MTEQTAEPIVTRLRIEAEYCEAYGEWPVAPTTLTEAADLITEMADALRAVTESGMRNEAYDKCVDVLAKLGGQLRKAGGE